MIIMRNGDKFIDKFVETKGGCGVYELSGKLKGSAVRQVVIYKG